MNLWMSNAIASQLNDPWASSFQPESEALFAAMVPTPDAGRKLLIDNLIVTLKTGGVWSKLDRLLNFVSHSLQAGTLNWIDPASTAASLDGYATWQVDYAFKGDGDLVFDTSSILTGFVPSAASKFVLNHAEMGYYLRAIPSFPPGSSAHRPLMGATDVTYNAALSLADHLALPGAWCLSYRKASNRLQVAMCTDVEVQTPTNVNAIGLTAVVQPNSIGDPAIRVWKQGNAFYSLDTTLPGATKTRPGVEVALGAVNFGAGTHFSSDAHFGLFYAGRDLTIPDRSLIATALETFIAAV